MTTAASIPLVRVVAAGAALSIGLPACAGDKPANTASPSATEPDPGPDAGATANPPPPGPAAAAAAPAPAPAPAEKPSRPSGPPEPDRTNPPPPRPDPAPSQASADLPRWDDVASGHPQGATNPPSPVLEVTADGKRCFKDWWPGMRPPEPDVMKYGGRILTDASEARGTEVQCESTRVERVLQAKAEADAP